MSLARYFVFPHDQRWIVALDGAPIALQSDRKAAITSAIPPRTRTPTSEGGCQAILALARGSGSAIALRPPPEMLPGLQMRHMRSR